jgi:hypothetical protein
MKNQMPCISIPRRTIKERSHNQGWAPHSLSFLAIAALLVSLDGSPAAASENGAAHYPTGTNTVVPALMPLPGDSLWLNYLTYYTADRFNNSSGASSVPGYLVNAESEAARLLHTWTSFDGVAWTSGVVLIATDAKLNVPHMSGSGGGFGDLVLQPLLLTAAFGNLHVLGGFDVSLPTGNYTKDKLVNPGFNYTTVAPQVALTWLPTTQVELSLFSIAGFNSKNPATQYTSGDYLDIDYSIGYRPVASLRALQFSVVGYYFDQFTDDQLKGRQFLDGHRSKVFSVGPQARYQFAKGGIALKWLHETSAENRPEGDRIQLQFAVPL